MVLNINGRIKVKTLQSKFKNMFGLTLRVYKEHGPANSDATLASVRQGDSKGGELLYDQNTKVGDIEDMIMDMIGIKTKIAGSDDSYLCNTDLTLASALKKDEKIISHEEKITEIITTSSEIEEIRELTVQEYKWLDKVWCSTQVPKSILGSRSFIFEAVKRRGNILKFAPSKFKNDKKIVLEAVKNNGSALEFASDELKKDKDTVLAAIKQFGCALEFASDEFKNDRNILLVAVKKNGSALEFASDELKNDKEVVLAAVQCNGSALEYASNELKDNKDVVLAAIKKWDWALKFASNKLKNNRNIVLEAIKKDISSLKYASPKLRVELNSTLSMKMAS